MDVVVYLLNDKDVIIDVKVSLVVYECYFNSDDEDECVCYLKEYVNLICMYIKMLGVKDY